MRQGKPGGGKGPRIAEDLSLTLATANDQVVFVDRPRKFMPIEGERLQGFPDNHTDIPWKGAAHAPDTLRWKAIGNSMCVNVMRWIGERIQAVEEA
jgi:DNA (cytosine-5)-methyltransferase 1